MSEKKICLKKIFGLKKFLVWKKFSTEKAFESVQFSAGKKFCVWKIFVSKTNFGYEKILGLKNIYLRSKKYFLVMLDFANHPTTETQCQQYLSCFWPNFDETLNVDSWKHLEQIPSVMVTFFQATFVLTLFVHIRNISALTVMILAKL